MRPSLAVINPNASQLRDPAVRATVAAALRRVLRERDGVEPRVEEPADARAAIHLAMAAMVDGVGLIVGAGGDGTLKDLAQVVSGTDVPLGMVPGGTGNVFASVLGVPGDLVAAVEALRDAAVRVVDLGDVRVELDQGEGRPPEVRHLSFMVGAGIGFDARVMETTPPGLKRRLGRTAYFLQAARLAARIGAVPYRVTVDGETVELEGSIALVTNLAELVPGLVRTRLPVIPDDGLFDVFVVGARNPVAGMRGLVHTLVTTDLGHAPDAGALRLRGRHVRLEAMPHEPLQVDGDPLGPGALEATIRPHALRVLVPAAAGGDGDGGVASASAEVPG
ncbi:MAG: diacylglycerol kinase family protein [Chloroflexota bacterium]